MIELLVVIAIIGILAAMIFAGIQRAGETARTITCMNTLRQWALGFSLYANDNDGYLPTSGFTATTDKWQVRIAPYVAGNPATYAYPQMLLRNNFHCPGDTAAATGWCYATNLFLLTPPSSFIVRRFSDIPHPAATIILVEANACGVWNLAPSSTTAAGMQYNHHGNGLANFAFADLHMQSLSSTAAPAMLQANQILLDPSLQPGQ